MNDGELDRLLQALHAEEPPPGALAAVRARVQERLAAQRRTRLAAWLWAPAAVAVAALALMVWMPLFRPLPRVDVAAGGPGRPRNDLILGAYGPATEVPDEVDLGAGNRGGATKTTQETAHNTHKTPQKRQKNALFAKSGGADGERTEFVKIFTDDPDVVILWAMNTKGE